MPTHNDHRVTTLQAALSHTHAPQDNRHSRTQIQRHENRFELNIILKEDTRLICKMILYATNPQSLQRHETQPKKIQHPHQKQGKKSVDTLAHVVCAKRYTDIKSLTVHDVCLHLYRDGRTEKVLTTVYKTHRCSFLHSIEGRCCASHVSNSHTHQCLLHKTEKIGNKNQREIAQSILTAA